MMKREEARKITNEINKAKAEKITAKAKVFVDERVDTEVRRCATLGKEEALITIPSDIDKKQVVEFIEECGFTVKGEFSYNEYKISW